MSDGTRIEWTDATANVVNGCSVLSPGCANCYAMRLAGTRMRKHPTRQDTASGGSGRCYALARTKIEEAVMWAVKGLTG